MQSLLRWRGDARELLGVFAKTSWTLTLASHEVGLKFCGHDLIRSHDHERETRENKTSAGNR